LKKFSYHRLGNWKHSITNCVTTKFLGHHIIGDQKTSIANIVVTKKLQLPTLWWPKICDQDFSVATRLAINFFQLLHLIIVGFMMIKTCPVWSPLCLPQTTQKCLWPRLTLGVIRLTLYWHDARVHLHLDAFIALWWMLGSGDNPTHYLNTTNFYVSNPNVYFLRFNNRLSIFKSSYSCNMYQK
jgi:hypothetical protein